MNIQKRNKIALLAPYIGVVNRGAESFVIELTKQLREDFDVVVFSQNIAPEIKENIVTVNVFSPSWLMIYKNIYKKIQEKAAYSGRNIFSNIFSKCSKLFLRLIYFSTYLAPETIEQYYFTKNCFENHINKEQFSLLYPNNGIWGTRFSQVYRKKTGTPFIYTGHGSIGEEEKKIILASDQHVY